MKTEKISTVQFCSKQRFVKPKQLEVIRELSNKMRKESSMWTTEHRYTASYIGAVRTGECCLYSDSFMHSKDSKAASECSGTTEIEFKNGNIIEVNNETGEITKIKKPWYTPIHRILKKMDKYLTAINSNFDNDYIVTKSSLKIHGFTEKGLQKIMSGDLKIDGEVNV